MIHLLHLTFIAFFLATVMVVLAVPVVIFFCWILHLILSYFEDRAEREFYSYKKNT